MRPLAAKPCALPDADCRFGSTPAMPDWQENTHFPPHIRRRVRRCRMPPSNGSLEGQTNEQMPHSMHDSRP